MSKDGDGVDRLGGVADRRRGRRRNRAGYTMVALLITITIMSILMGVAVEEWGQVMRRDREEELIFRGKQYVEAIRLFQKRNGRLPMALKELYEIKPRTIRKLWKDPITDSLDWGLVFQGNVTSEMLGGGAPAGGSTASGRGPGGGSRRDSSQGRATGGTGFGSSFSPTGSPHGGQVAVGPIVGVYSRSTEKSIRIYNGRQRYSDWKFSIIGPGQGGVPGASATLPPMGGGIGQTK